MRLIGVIALALALASPVRAAGGVALVYDQYSEGGASAHVLARLVACRMSDDLQTRIYQGTLDPQQQFTVVWDWCSTDDILMEEGHPWEGSFEGLAVDVSGKGSFLVEVLEDTTPLTVHPMPPPQNGYQAWHRCATYHNRVTVTGSAFGTTTLRVTNVGTRLARNVSIGTYLATNGSGFLDAHCPVTSDWGF